MRAREAGKTCLGEHAVEHAKDGHKGKAEKIDVGMERRHRVIAGRSHMDAKADADEQIDRSGQNEIS